MELSKFNIQFKTHTYKQAFKKVTILLDDFLKLFYLGSFV